MQTAILCVRAASFTCALPITDVVETMRPLPVKPMHGAPLYVLGLTLVRGQPSVVVDASLLLGGSSGHTEAHRFVSLRSMGQPVVLAVESVLGIRHLDLSSMQPMPRGIGSHPASRALGTLDQNLMLSLDVHQLFHDAGLAAMQSI